MLTNDFRFSKHWAVALAFAAALGGCSTANPPSGSAAYKKGALGNGSFLFACDDGAACLPYSGDAAKFPKAIATGSTFDVRFVPNNQQGSVVTVDDKNSYDGLKLSALEPYVKQGTDGFVAEKPGSGTIFARDSHNTVVDYVTLNIVQPDSLIVYDASYDGSDGSPLRQINAATMSVEDRVSYRVVAAHATDEVAGSIPVVWASDTDTVVEVESYTNHVVTIHAKKAGTAKLTASGAALNKSISVEVK